MDVQWKMKSAPTVTPKIYKYFLCVVLLKHVNIFCHFPLGALCGGGLTGNRYDEGRTFSTRWHHPSAVTCQWGVPERISRSGQEADRLLLTSSRRPSAWRWGSSAELLSWDGSTKQPDNPVPLSGFCSAWMSSDRSDWNFSLNTHLLLSLVTVEAIRGLSLDSSINNCEWICLRLIKCCLIFHAFVLKPLFVSLRNTDFTKMLF